MNDKKQIIEEMIDDLMACHTEFYENAELYTDYHDMAENLYSKGYRKQSEGEWREVDTIDDGWTQYRCSGCGWNTEGYYKEKYDLHRYCPNCGAHMKGGAEE